MVMLLEGVRAEKVASLSDIPQHLQVGSALGPWGPCCTQPTGWGLRCFLSLGIQQPPPLVPSREKLGSDGPGLTGRQPPAQAPQQEWNSSWAAPP